MSRQNLVTLIARRADQLSALDTPAWRDVMADSLDEMILIEREALHKRAKELRGPFPTEIADKARAAYNSMAAFQRDAARQIGNEARLIMEMVATRYERELAGFEARYPGIIDHVSHTTKTA